MTRPRFDAAACRTPDLEAVFARGVNSPVMRAACGRCQDRPECLTWSLRHEPFGFWGGHTAAGRKRLRAQFGIDLEEISAGQLGIHHERDATSHEHSTATTNQR